MRKAARCHAATLNFSDAAAAPWARATNNVKKPMNYAKKLDLRFFVKQKPKHFWFQSHI
jgi:hypothetical protein